MLNKKNKINKRCIAGIYIALFMFLLLDCNEIAEAKWKDIKTSTGYTITTLNIPYKKFKHEKLGTHHFYNSFAKKGNKEFVAHTSAFFWVTPDVYKTYKITWDSKGKASITDGMKVPDSSDLNGPFKIDDKGNSYLVDTYRANNKNLYICDLHGELTATWYLDDKIKFYSKSKNKSYGIVDYEVQKNKIYMLITETLKKGKALSVQVFDLKTGKRKRVYKLPYKFDRIDNGYLYGITKPYNREVYGYNYPVKKGFYKYSIDGKKCMWSYDFATEKEPYYPAFDISKNKIIYQSEKGLYALDTAKKKKPELLVTSKECKVLKEYYSDIINIYAFDTDAIYIPFNYEYEHTMGTEMFVLKITK